MWGGGSGGACVDTHAIRGTEAHLPQRRDRDQPWIVKLEQENSVEEESMDYSPARLRVRPVSIPRTGVRLTSLGPPRDHARTGAAAWRRARTACEHSAHRRAANLPRPPRDHARTGGSTGGPLSANTSKNDRRRCRVACERVSHSENQPVVGRGGVWRGEACY